MSISEVETWMIELEGHEYDLQLLQEQCRGASYVIERSIKKWLLKLSARQFPRDSAEITQVMQDLIDVLNGLAKLHSNGYSPVAVKEGTLVGTRADGTECHYALIVASIVQRMRIDAAVVGRAEGIDKIPGVLRDGLRVKDDSGTASVLTILGRSHPAWAEMYVAYEIMKRDVGGRDQLAENGWASDEEIRRFTHTANSYDVLGIEARHGPNSLSAPDNPMPRREAADLLRSMAKRWVRDKGYLR